MSNGFHTYAELRGAVLARRAVGVYWRDLLMSGSDVTNAQLHRWKVENRIPHDVLATVEQMNVARYVRPLARAWTYPENELFRRLHRENKSAFQIATMMQQAFGRTFAVDGIARKMRAVA